MVKISKKIDPTLIYFVLVEYKFDKKIKLINMVKYKKYENLKNNALGAFFFHSLYPRYLLLCFFSEKKKSIKFKIGTFGHFMLN